MCVVTVSMYVCVCVNAAMLLLIHVSVCADSQSSGIKDLF